MYEFTQEDRRRGGVASGEARRNKRTLRSTMELLLCTELPDDEKATLAASGFPCTTFMDALVAAVIESAKDGNAQAFWNIVRLVGEDVQRVEIANYDDSFTKLEEWIEGCREEYKNDKEKQL